MIQIFNEDLFNKHIKHKKIQFPSGEIGVDIMGEICLDISKIKIVADISGTPDEIVELFLVIDAVKNIHKNRITLELPYIPFGRQDRHTTKTSAFSLKVFADIINGFALDEVKTLTPHSNVSELLINNLKVEEPLQELATFIKHNSLCRDAVIVAPDAGAEKRAYVMAAAVGIKDVYVCSKRRNAVTGEIVCMVAPVIPSGCNIIVVDDICDGGTTFIELEKVLPRDRKSLSLFVSHGIFSKGMGVLHKYDFVHAVNLVEGINRDV